MRHFGDEGLSYCGRETRALTRIPWKVTCGNCLRQPEVIRQRAVFKALAEASVA